MRFLIKQGLEWKETKGFLAVLSPTLLSFGVSLMLVLIVIEFITYVVDKVENAIRINDFFNFISLMAFPAALLIMIYILFHYFCNIFINENDKIKYRHDVILIYSLVTIALFFMPAFYRDVIEVNPTGIFDKDNLITTFTFYPLLTFIYFIYHNSKLNKYEDKKIHNTEKETEELKERLADIEQKLNKYEKTDKKS